MRLAVALILSLLINTMLFILMQRMVTGGRVELSRVPDAQLLDFIRVPDEEPSAPPRRLRRAPPEPPEKPPAPMRAARVPAQKVQQQPMPLPFPALKVETPLTATVDVSAPYVGPVMAETVAAEAGDFIMASELTPILRTPPPYPEHLRRRRVEGHVLVEFTVTARGRVEDLEIIEAHPPRVFDAAVRRAVGGWRFEPEEDDGVPVAVRARQRVVFSLSR